MAISLGFGIIFTTFVTLLLVPINYLIFHSENDHATAAPPLIHPDLLR